ncbi:MAG: hypothetical protein IJX91_05555 [Clostridia bacterium]|nr:hypothetical protein [Clostridia bacterium]
MGKVKKTMKKIGRQIWELFKGSIPAALMYFCAGAVLLMLTMKGEDIVYAWDSAKLGWTLVCGIVAMAYNGLVSYAQGGNAYEMLVSGNMKRVSAAQYGEGFKISTHKEAKEYRIWKGFAVGAFCGLFTLIAGLIFGINQTKINTVFEEGGAWGVGFGVVVIACFLLSGWSILPFFYLNASGYAISYFLTCLFALIPIAITGGMYIAGAYGKRNKTIRQQELADKAAAAEANKPKKINYGGLPGTKPKKRK